MQTDLFGIPAAAPAPVQFGIDFPESLTEKYRPRAIDEFIGLDKVKRVMHSLLAAPRASAWLFVGAPGTGKSTMALALAESLPAELHKIPSQECNVAAIERVRAITQALPMGLFRKPGDSRPYRFHLILADEINRASSAAQDSLHSKLDATNFFPNTIFIGTCNTTDGMSPALLSRFHVIEFSSYGLGAPAAELLKTVWSKETAPDAPAPNFARLVKDSNNNVRESLMRLETEIMCA